MLKHKGGLHNAAIMRPLRRAPGAIPTRQPWSAGWRPVARADRAGRARQVKIYSHSPEGVVTVKFRSADAAAQCLALMAGRFFGGRRLVAELWDGVATWHAAKPKETPEEQAARLEAFARALEAGKAGGAEGGAEGGKEGGTHGGAEGGAEGPKEGGAEGGAAGPKEGAMEGVVEGEREEGIA